MSLILDYNVERENNIIKNIALEIVAECAQIGLEVTPELANYVVKIKLLNPKNGFTASEVMPRSLTQQLVTSAVEDLKLKTPAMNCIRMQVYWNSTNLNVADLKNQYIENLSEKAEVYFNEMMNLSREDLIKMTKLLTLYIVASHNLGQVNNQVHFKETAGAVYSIFKNKDALAFFNSNDEEKVKKIKTLSHRAAGVRLYLKYRGKGGEGIEEVKDLYTKVEQYKDEITAYSEKLSTKIENIRTVINSVIVMDFFEDVVAPGEVFLPPETDMEDFLYLKKILIIMLQHSLYLSDISSKLDEIDGTLNFYIKEYNETLQRLHEVIRDREAVPTTEVYDDFERAGELFLEIQSYYYCLDVVRGVARKLEQMNKKHYFAQTNLEKTIFEKVNIQEQKGSRKRTKSEESSKIFSSALILKDYEDFTIEFNGFCALTLFYTRGLLVPGVPEAGIFQLKDQYYAFAEKRRHEIWAKDPLYYLTEIYNYLRDNPEMIELLNAYDHLYHTKSLQQAVKVERKILTRSADVQTVVHPIEEYWDKDYTFSIWELKKQALMLSRLVKCVTKSVQTVSPHSHFRASIGVLASPDKDKEVQTKKDSSCVHSAISNYLYGLRGHREDKFRVIELTRPIDETCEKQIILEKGDPCRERRVKKPIDRRHFYSEPCPSMATDDKCDYYYYYCNDNELFDQYNEL